MRFLILMAFTALAVAAAHLGAGWELSPELIGPLALAGFNIPVIPKTREELMSLATPKAVTGGQSEALSWVFYDTQTYVSGTTTELSFFTTTNVSRAITNLEAGGQLTEPKFFEIYYFGLDVLEPVTSGGTGAPDAWNDIQQLVMDGQGFWRFTISDKQYGAFPLSFCHTSGGVQGYGFAEQTTAGAQVVNAYGLNSVPDGGWCVDGALVIPPKVGFDVRVQWPTALTLGADRDLRFWMAGVLHRRVL